MKNILSFIDKSTSGKDIKEWIIYHSKNNTEYSIYARHMKRFLNIKDDGLYHIVTSPDGTGCGEKRNLYPIVVKDGGSK